MPWWVPLRGMDRLVVLGGSGVAATTVTVGIMTAGTPEAVAAALLLSGVLTGAGSRSFQSEFLDAFAAGTFGFAVAVTLVSFGFGGVRAANALLGSSYNFGVLVYVASLGFSPIPGLCAAIGGSAGARLQYAVRDRADGA